MILLLNNFSRPDRLAEIRAAQSLNRENVLFRGVYCPDEGMGGLGGLGILGLHGFARSNDPVLDGLMPGPYWDLSEYARLAKDIGTEGEPVVVANSDIWFDFLSARRIIEDLDFNTLWVLGKWNHNTLMWRPEVPKSLDEYRDGPYEPGDFLLSSGWQDAFIFRCGTPEIEEIHIPLGTVFCELRMAHAAHRLGLNTLNPMYSVKARHIHVSEPKYAKEKKEFGTEKDRTDDLMHVPPVSLDDIPYCNMRFPTKWNGYKVHSYPRS